MKTMLALAALLLAGCAVDRVEIVPVPLAPWVCSDEPAIPRRPDGSRGFVGPGRATIRLADGSDAIVADGWAIGRDDLGRLTDYEADLRAAYRSCRRAIDDANRVGRSP